RWPKPAAGPPPRRSKRGVRSVCSSSYCLRRSEAEAERNGEQLSRVLVGAVVVVAVLALGLALLEQQVPVGHVDVEGALLPAEARADPLAVGVGEQRSRRSEGGRRLVVEIAAAQGRGVADAALEADAVLEGVLVVFGDGSREVGPAFEGDGQLG